ncbi:hypothetical protein K3718_07705 [Leisingera aquaemixtae]|uniref:Intracellular septation protein A n=1 Tax=Leisingera aquaemixtae TaxID=1396826 RepID=A0ABY5WN62_9RHOB|nr:hypothetical protein [Leisingera aquaemixtae]UWQ42962.1 hypothetical protein K3718_07705 [Leisingera aquaemixtae]
MSWLSKVSEKVSGWLDNWPLAYGAAALFGIVAKWVLVDPVMIGKMHTVSILLSLAVPLLAFVLCQMVWFPMLWERHRSRNNRVSQVAKARMTQFLGKWSAGVVVAAILLVVLWNLWVYDLFEGKPRVAVYFLVLLLVGLFASVPFAAIKFYLDKLRLTPAGGGERAG